MKVDVREKQLLGIELDPMRKANIPDVPNWPSGEKALTLREVKQSQADVSGSSA